MPFDNTNTAKTEESVENHPVIGEKAASFLDVRPTKTITAPVNAEFIGSNAGIPATHTFEPLLVPEKLKPITPDFGATETLGVQQGASTVSKSSDSTDHVVEVHDCTHLPHKFYDYLVHCVTCGWEARINGGTTSLKQAQNVADDHIARKRNMLVTGRYHGDQKH